MVSVAMARVYNQTESVSCQEPQWIKDYSAGFPKLEVQGSNPSAAKAGKCDGALNPPVILGYHWLVQSLKAG